MEAQLVFILDGLAEPSSPTTMEIARTPFLDSLSQRGESGQLDLGWTRDDPSSESGILRLCGAAEVAESFSRSLLLYGAFHASSRTSGDEKWVWLLNPARIADNRLDSYVEDGPTDSFWKAFLDIASCRSGRFEYLPVRENSGKIARLLATHPTDGRSPGSSPPPRRGAALPDKGLVGDLVNDAIACIPAGAPFHCVWPWGVGKWDPTRMIPPPETEGKWMIAGSPLARAIGKVLGWKTPLLKEATGDVDTSLACKGDAILGALGSPGTSHVFCHIEGFDLASHRRNVLQKVRFLEEFDRVMGPVLTACFTQKRFKGVWFTCDHLSSPVTGNHEKGHVPYLHVSSFDGATVKGQGAGKWTEKIALSGPLHTIGSWKESLALKL